MVTVQSNHFIICYLIETEVQKWCQPQISLTCLYSVTGPMTRILNWIEHQLNPIVATDLVSLPFTELPSEITSPVPRSDESFVDPP